MPRKPEPPKKKSSGSFAGMFLDVVGYGVRQAALPVPDMPKWMKNKLKGKKK